jgi:predicted nuclease with TOPRIM domain
MIPPSLEPSWIDVLTLAVLAVAAFYTRRELRQVRPLIAGLKEIHEDLKAERRAFEIAQTENEELFMRALDCNKKLRHCYRDCADLKTENERLKGEIIRRRERPQSQNLLPPGDISRKG